MLRKQIIGIALIAAALSGCATTPGAGGTSAANPPLAQTAQAGTLADVGLAGTPETVFVPARYRSNTTPALYINGRQFVAPGGYSHVAGFLPMASGYLVAVVQPTVSAQSTDRNKYPFLVFYQVDANGQGAQQLGVVANVVQAYVGRDGIYGAQPAAGDFRNYYGYSVAGEPSAGPQGVLHATPAPDGGWYIARFEELSESDFYRQYGIYHQAESGASTRLGQVRRDTRVADALVQTTAMFVNRPPLADSVRCACWLAMKMDYDYYTDGAGSDFELYALSLGHAANALQTQMLAHIGTPQNISRRQVLSLAARTIALPGGFAMQIPAQGFGGLYWGLVTPDHAAGEPRTTPVFELMSGGWNTLRSFMGNNTANMSMNDANDVYAILTPTANVMVLVGGKTDMPDAGPYAVTVGSPPPIKLSTAQIQPLLYRYGMTR